MRCDHCLLDFPEREAIREEIGGAARTFCCTGCAGVCRLIVGEGLTGFYDGRKWDEAGLLATPGAADPAAFEPLLREAGPGERELDLAIDGIRCASCVWLNERILGRTPGVAAARVNYATHRARIRFRPAEVSLPAILRRIESIGYAPRPWSESEQGKARDAERRDLLLRLGTAGFLASQLMIYSAALYAGAFQGIDAAIRRLMEWIALGLTLPAVGYAGAPFFRAAWAGLRRGRFNMDSLIALGAGSALLLSVAQMARGGGAVGGGGEVYFDTAAMIVALILLGRYLEAAAKGRASEAVARLQRLAPRQARRVTLGPAGVRDRQPVPVEAIRPGDLLEAAPGERIALDGEVLEGTSEVDESLVTGEARPVEKAPGSEVIGGSVNQHGSLLFRVTRVGKDTVLAGIARAVEEAQAHKPRLQAVADRVVGIFVPAVLLLAVGTVGGWLWLGAPLPRALMNGVAVVVIACPCALGLATPLAVLVATGRATARGILLRGGDVLERLAAATEILLDKTGTLTRGRPALREVIPLDGTAPEALLRLAAAVERRSEHHVGRAIAAAERVLPAAPEPALETFRALPGRGVEAGIGGDRVRLGNRALLAEAGIPLGPETDARARALEERGETVVFLCMGGAVRALLAVADPVRPEAPGALASLGGLGLGLGMLTGDNRATAAAVGAGLGLGRIEAEQTPAGKRDRVAERQRSGARVVAVGDGINDAPVLSQADVGIAMGRGVDVALESADAVLVREDLRLLPEAVVLARRATRIIRQNVFWAFFYNAVAIPLAMAGWMHPIVAAAAMAASSLFVVGNSMRIRRGS